MGSEMCIRDRLKLLKSKVPRGFVIPILKVSVTNPQGFLYLSNYYILIIKLILQPPTLRLQCTVQLQIEIKQKMLGRSVTFGVKSVEKRPPRANFFELSTPIEYVFQVMRSGIQESI